jgi:TRAP-type C4-dicarboxylate transport system permease small subunit
MEKCVPDREAVALLQRASEFLEALAAVLTAAAALITAVNVLVRALRARRGHKIDEG